MIEPTLELNWSKLNFLQLVEEILEKFKCLFSVQDECVDINLLDGDEATPLHFAASRGHADTVSADNDKLSRWQFNMVWGYMEHWILFQIDFKLTCSKSPLWN